MFEFMNDTSLVLTDFWTWDLGNFGNYNSTQHKVFPKSKT